VKALAVCAALFTLAVPSAFANAPDARLDAAVSELAGHHVTVVCETDADAWQALLVQFNELRFVVHAFTAGTTVYFGPSVCLTLRNAIHAGAPASPTLAPGDALQTLIFEGLNQSAPMLGKGREPFLECDAVTHVAHYATSLYGIPAKVYVAKTVYRWKNVRVNGRLVRKRVAIKVRVLVANPRIAAIVKQADDARRLLPIPYYMGVCP
jgi:hypothetical protein